MMPVSDVQGAGALEKEKFFHQLFGVVSVHPIYAITIIFEQLVFDRNVILKCLLW